VPSFTLCWDNTQIEVKARNQDKQANVWQRIWALCYAAVNRVDTELLSDDMPDTNVMDAPLRVFLPDAAHSLEVRQWMAFEIKKSLSQFLPVFREVRKRLPAFIQHAHWDDMARKSDVVSYICQIHLHCKHVYITYITYDDKLTTISPTSILLLYGTVL
jgi:hypothetical protein